MPRPRPLARLLARRFHPELRTLARVLPTSAVRGPRTLHALRWLESRSRVPAGLDIRSCGPCEVVVHRPDGPPRGLVLWIHGGGLILGSGKDDPDSLRQLAHELDALVVSVDYRRAPEHCYPAAIDDCYAALVWASSLEEVAGLPVVVAGGSAGAGLAAAVALVARDKRQVELAAQILIYPMLDDRTIRVRDRDKRVRRLWNNRANALGWRSYLGDRAATADVPAYAAAARAENLHGLPPAWIGVGSLDLFHDEDVAYAERLLEAGVPCDLVVVPGAFHGFDLAKSSRVARDFRASYVSAMARALG